jgi:hypothetical protein
MLATTGDLVLGLTLFLILPGLALGGVIMYFIIRKAVSDGTKRH